MPVNTHLTNEIVSKKPDFLTITEAITIVILQLLSDDVAKASVKIKNLITSYNY